MKLNNPLESNPRIWWIDLREHSGHRGRTNTGRYAAWNRLPITGFSYVQVIEKFAFHQALERNESLEAEVKRLKEIFQRVEAASHSWVIRKDTAELLSPIHEKYRNFAKQALNPGRDE